MSHRRYDLLLLLCTLAGGLAWWLAVRTPAGVIVREPVLDPRAAAYMREFTQRPKRTPSTPKFSPDSRWIVVDSAFRESYLTIRVFDAQTRGVLPVVTIREADPGSGRSVRMGWSSDSRALIIRGAGALWRQENRTLCLVYLPIERELLSDASCEATTP